MRGKYFAKCGNKRVINEINLFDETTGKKINERFCVTPRCENRCVESFHGHDMHTGKRFMQTFSETCTVCRKSNFTM